MAARNTQEAVEILLDNNTAQPRYSQVAIEIMVPNDQTEPPISFQPIVMVI